MHRILSIIALLLLSLSGFSQATVDFPGEINLVKMTDPGIAIVGTDDALYGVDANGSLLWNNEKLRKVEAERVEVLSGSELVFVSDKGLLARNRVLNVLNGEEYANTGTKGENVYAARVVHGTNQLWVMPDGSKIQAWDIASNRHEYTLTLPKGMKVATSQSASLTATFSGMQPITYTSTHEAILHLSLGHLGKYDLTTGDVIWMTDFKPLKPKADKGDKASNPIDGYGVMKLDVASNTLYFPFRENLLAIDATNGKLKWDIKANKPGKIRDLYVLEEGILVLTYAGLQMIDPTSGAEKWKKPIKIKGAEEGLLFNDEGTFYAVSKNNMVKIDLQKHSSQVLTEKIKFQGGESFSNLEVIDDVIVLSSAQNVVVVNKHSGQILESVYYKKPGPGLTTIAQNVALAAVAAAASANSYNLNSQQGNRTYYQYTPAMMTTRGGSSANNQWAYISTKFKGEDANGFGIARVEKATGKTAQKILIGNREAIFDVDESSAHIFYKADKKSLGIKAIQ